MLLTTDYDHLTNPCIDVLWYKCHASVHLTYDIVCARCAEFLKPVLNCRREL